MSASLVIILIVALITLVTIVAAFTARSRSRRLEANRVAAAEARGLADMKARTAEQERLQAERHAEAAQRQRTEAEVLRARAAELDPDHMTASRR